MNGTNELKKVRKARDPNSVGKSSSFKKSLRNILGGNFLAQTGMINLLPFLFFITFLTILYIANIYYAEKDIREFNALKKELKELRYEYITSKSNLMNVSKQSEITRRLLGSGVKESVVPPYKIFIELKEDN